jgi:hypothetical protein
MTRKSLSGPSAVNPNPTSTNKTELTLKQIRFDLSSVHPPERLSKAAVEELVKLSAIWPALLPAKDAGDAIIAPSNFFLFFSSNTVGNHSPMHMN